MNFLRLSICKMWILIFLRLVNASPYQLECVPKRTCRTPIVPAIVNTLPPYLLFSIDIADRSYMVAFDAPIFAQSDFRSFPVGFGHFLRHDLLVRLSLQVRRLIFEVPPSITPLSSDTWRMDMWTGDSVIAIYCLSA